MYQYDVDTFMCACDRKGLAAKTMKSYEQTLRLFGLFLAERGITQTEEIRHAQRIGLKEIHPHCFRNNFAKRFLMNGGDIYTLSRLLGAQQRDRDRKSLPGRRYGRPAQPVPEIQPDGKYGHVKADDW